MIEDSNYFGKQRVKIIKLVEVGEEAHKHVSSGDANNNDETQIHKESQDNPVTLDSEPESDGPTGGQKEGVDESRSEVSNFSLSVGDDMRQLKDMKAKITEKHTPGSISFLKATSLIISALLIALVCKHFFDFAIL